MYKSPIDGWGFLFVCAQLASWLRIYRPSLRVSGEHFDVASLPLAQQAFRLPAGSRVTFLCWPKEK
jgi:hypothetical protein